MVHWIDRDEAPPLIVTDIKLTEQQRQAAEVKPEVAAEKDEKPPVMMQQQVQQQQAQHARKQDPDKTPPADNDDASPSENKIVATVPRDDQETGCAVLQRQRNHQAQMMGDLGMR
jgi:hypothetical protein